MRSWEEIRKDFPILKEKVHGKDLIYLDNAATTQLPQQVLDRFVEHYTKYNANVHRGIHYLSEQSTMHMEAVRNKLKAFLHAEGQGEIIFTSGGNRFCKSGGTEFSASHIATGGCGTFYRTGASCKLCCMAAGLSGVQSGVSDDSDGGRRSGNGGCTTDADR